MSSLLIDPLAVLNALPGNHLILRPDAPTFTIVGVTDAYLTATYTQREMIMGKGVFEALPDSAHNQQGIGAVNLGASLREVLHHKRPHAMAEQRYDVLNPQTGQFDVKVWKPLNQPVLDAKGEVSYIIHSVEDITEVVQLREAGRLASQQQQTFLLRLSDRLRSLTDPADMQYQAACLLGEYTGASRVGYAEDSQDGQTIVVTRNYTNGVAGIEGRYRYEDYGAELMVQLQAGHTVIRPDIAQDPSLTQAEKRAHARLQLGATLNKPLMKSGQLVAVLFLHFEGPHDFTERELSLLEETAERTWEAVSRARAEAALRTSEARLRAIIEESPVAMALLMGPDFRIEMANPLSVARIGKGPSVIGQFVRDAMPGLENQPFLDPLTEVFTTGNPFEAKAVLARIVVDGVLNDYYLDLHYKPLRDAAGEVYAILATSIDVTQQVRMRQELAQQKTYLQNALSIADLGTFFVDVAADTATFSENVRRWYGLPHTTEPFETVLAKIHPEDLTRVQAIIGVALQSEARSQHDFVYRVVNSAQGGDVYIRSFGKAQYQDGQPHSIIGVLQNVTEQVLARRKLEESEARFRSIVQQSPAATLVLRGDAFIIDQINRPMLAFMGRGEDIVGQPMLAVMPELDGQLAWQQVQRLYHEGISFDQQEVLVSHSRTGVFNDYYYNVAYRPLREGERITGMIQVANDVTEQVAARRQLEENERVLRSIIDLAELGSYTIEVATNRITQSPRLADWYGLPQQTDVAASIRSVDPSDQPRVSKVLTDALQPGSDGFYQVEYAINSQQSGYRRMLRTNGLVRRDAAGQAVRIDGTALDITAQRELQLELEQQVQQQTQQLQTAVADLRRSNDNLEQFAYIASHDLQEPLRKIQSFGDLLKTHYADSLGEGIEMLERMQTAASRMSRLIKDLLTYSRIATQQDATAPVALDDVLQGVLSDLDLRIRETGAQVVVVKGLPTVAGDVSQLSQLFQNLLSNALKFRRPNTPPLIQVSCRQVGVEELPPSVRPTRAATAYYRIGVSDNGIGFDAKYVDRIFQVFQRLHGKNEFAGTGIGLAICEKVAANHGGAITATSQPGQGATFSVYLPA